MYLSDCTLRYFRHYNEFCKDFHLCVEYLFGKFNVHNIRMFVDRKYLKRQYNAKTNTDLLVANTCNSISNQSRVIIVYNY